MSETPIVNIGILPGKGRAVIAKAPVLRGTVITQAPAWQLGSEERERTRGSRVFDIVFVRREEYQCGRPCEGYIVFGIFSLCNHADEPNAVVEWSVGPTGTWARLVALRDIVIGEEVTLQYVNIAEYSNASEFV